MNLFTNIIFTFNNFNKYQKFSVIYFKFFKSNILKFNKLDFYFQKKNGGIPNLSLIIGLLAAKFSSSNSCSVKLPSIPNIKLCIIMYIVASYYLKVATSAFIKRNHSLIEVLFYKSVLNRIRVVKTE